MKIRNGFVSNSSSSSFILKVTDRPSTVEKTLGYLFGENPPTFTALYGDKAISTKQVAKIIFDDIEEADIFDIDTLMYHIKEEIGSFNDYNYNDGVDFVGGTEYEKEYDMLYSKVIEYENNNNKFEDWDKYYTGLNKLSKPIFELIEKILRDKYTVEDEFVNVSYIDNDGSVYTYIEHSGILNKLLVNRFSKH